MTFCCRFFLLQFFKTLADEEGTYVCISLFAPDIHAEKHDPSNYEIFFGKYHGKFVIVNNFVPFCTVPFQINPITMDP
uniref:Uncharacterized protein n=1 Tax=Caenorhabditis japonica TaxID=281687 RepID=A0A8R1ERH7_CAEJA